MGRCNDASARKRKNQFSLSIFAATGDFSGGTIHEINKWQRRPKVLFLLKAVTCMNLLTRNSLIW